MRGTTKVRAHLWTALAALPFVCAASCPEQLERSVDGMYVSGRDSASVTLGLIYLAAPTGAVGARGGPDETDAPVCPPFWTPDDPRPSPARTVCPRRDADYEVWAVGGGVHEGPITVPATRLGPVTSSDRSDPREMPAPTPPPPPPPPPATGQASIPAGWPAGIRPIEAHADTVRPNIQRTVRVGTSSEFMAAISGARPGDEILLRPGTTYSQPGGFRMPPRGDGGWVVIRTDLVVDPGTRVDTTLDFARIECTSGGCSSLLFDQGGDHGWRFETLEVIGFPQTNTPIRIHAGPGVPRRLVFDRVYVHPRTPNDELRRCAIANGASVAFLRSVLVECHERGAEAQGIALWATPGPILIYDNLISASSMGFIAGGADPANSGLSPSDIVIARNHFWRPQSWKGGPWTIKNCFELKNAHRVHVWGNVFENNWRDGQTGYCILMKSSGGPATFTRTEDVWFERNRILNSEQGFNLARNPDGGAQPMRRVLVEHTEISGLGPNGQNAGPEGSRTFLIQGPDELTIRNITSRNPNVHSAFEISQRGNGLTIENVLIEGRTQYGFRMDRRGYGSLSMRDNVAVGDTCSNYPAGWSCSARSAPAAGADGRLVEAAIRGVRR